VEAVLRDEESDIEISRTSGRPTAFGWSLSGARIAVAFEEMSEDRKSSTRLLLTPCRQREARKGESDERQASRTGSPLVATDSVVAPYADNYFEYDPSTQRVSK